MAKILVAGCGDIGSGVASWFCNKGAEVVGMRRTGVEFPDGVFGITGDITQLHAEAWPDVDVLYLIMTPAGRSVDSYQAAYVDTAQAVIEAYHNRKAPQVIFVSSTSVYGQNQAQEIDESTLAEPESDTASKLLEAEQLLASALPTTSVRCSGIYGKNRYRMLEGLMAGTPWEANQWTNRIHRDDVVSALCFLGELALRGRELPPMVIATDNVPVSMWEVKLWLSTQLGVAISVPTENTVELFVPKKGKRIRATTLTKLGWQPTYCSYVAGYKRIIPAFLGTQKKGR